jgi:phosphomannomutase
MSCFAPEIFKAYDIRGVYGEDFDAGFAQQLGNRFAGSVRAGTLVIGRDARASSDDLAYAVIDGAVHAGAQVIDIGEVSTPQFYWAVGSCGAAGGIMVTASHNADGENGFKVIGPHGRAMGGDQLRQIFDTYQTVHRAGGSMRNDEVISGYANAVADAAGWDGGEINFSIDAPGSVRRGLEQIAFIAPNEERAARFDEDGDRIIVHEHGQAIAADWIFLAMADALNLRPLVFDLRFSRAVREYLDHREVPYAVSRVGRSYLQLNMHERGAAFGAEISGHYYWNIFGGKEAPELVLLHLNNLIQRTGKSLTALIAPYVRYAKSDEISLPVRDRKAAAGIIHFLREKYSDGNRIEIDGLTVEYPDWWFNIRMSNTEPVLRVIVEATNKDLLDQKVAEVRARIG